MAMWTVIAKKAGATDVEIEDLGITITADTTLSDQYTFDELAGSDDLRAAIGTSDGDVIINDGSSDLSTADATDWLTLDNRKNVKDNHYTKSEMQGDGTAQLHWNNVTNAPSFGSPTWVDPVECQVLAIQAGTGGLTPSDGDFYIDTTNSPDELYKYTTSWAKVRDVVTGDRFIKLDEGDEAIFEYTDGDTPVDQGTPGDNEGVVVEDDGDGGQAQYVYNGTTTSWAKIGDVDFGPHLDGTANQHDASEIDVEGTYAYLTTGDLETALGDADDELDTLHTSIDGHLDGSANKHDASEVDVEGTYTYITTGDLETAIGDVDTELGNLNAAIPTAFNTLDEAYDEGGAGSGRVITADSGPVKIDSDTSTDAGFEIVPKASAPSTNLAGGQFFVDSATGIMYVYDATRSLWLSVNRFMVAFGEKGVVKDRNLSHYVGSMRSNNSGLRMIRDACIVGAAGQIDASGTCNIRVRRNDSATNLATLAISASTGAQDGTWNVSLSAGDFLQSYLEATTAVEDPALLVEIAWRK